jgi:serine/threonine protein kinase
MSEELPKQSSEDASSVDASSSDLSESGDSDDTGISTDGGAPERDGVLEGDGAPDDQSERSATVRSGGSDALVGQLLGDNYGIIEKIGASRVAVVYKAQQLSTDRIVAVKTLKVDDPSWMKRFEREIRTHASLKHPNIVEPIDCFSSETGRMFFVMELLEGISLEDIIKAEGRVASEEEIYSILSQILDALDYAYDKGVIHRDLKPSNIAIIHQDGKRRIKVLDFGLARTVNDYQKITFQGQAMGSPLYMSPEQCMGKELTCATDLYSLGISAYRMVTGLPPYTGKSLTDTLQAHCDPNIKPKNIQEIRTDMKNARRLNTLILKSLETDPEKRFKRPKEFKAELDTWIEEVRAGKSQQADRVPRVGEETIAQVFLIKSPATFLSKLNAGEITPLSLIIIAMVLFVPVIIIGLVVIGFFNVMAP